MRRERIEKKKVSSKVTLPEVLSLDPRDQDIVHAKKLTETWVPPRRRAS
jgi:hypothetical protein